jgi:hypothetical protein
MSLIALHGLKNSVEKMQKGLCLLIFRLDAAGLVGVTSFSMLSEVDGISVI